MPALLPNKHPIFTEKTMGKRCKWAISMILSGIASLGGVIIKGLNSYLNHKEMLWYQMPLNNFMKMTKYFIIDVSYAK